MQIYENIRYFSIYENTYTITFTKIHVHIRYTKFLSRLQPYSISTLIESALSRDSLSRCLVSQYIEAPVVAVDDLYGCGRTKLSSDFDEL